MAKRISKQRLSQVDSFFVAYQEDAGIWMHFGADMEVKGKVTLHDLRQAVLLFMTRFPTVAATLKKGLFGLYWEIPEVKSEVDNKIFDQMVKEGKREDIMSWKNISIDPFIEPPFQIMFAKNKSGAILSFKVHHSVSDGEFFSNIVYDVFESLSLILAKENIPMPEPVPLQSLFKVLAKDFSALKWRKWKSFYSYLNFLKQNSDSKEHCRIKLEQIEAGDINNVSSILDSKSYNKLKNANDLVKLNMSFVYAAAWILTIEKWNKEKGERDISLEIPVSLRKNKQRGTGNFISPLTIFKNHKQGLLPISREIRKQVIKGIKRQDHLAVPFFTFVGKYIPWFLYKKIAITPGSTGFATSHFTALKQSRNIYNTVEKLSKKQLELKSIQIYTPVCLHMGAALFVNEYVGHPPQFYITYRETGFSKQGAKRFMDIFQKEVQLYFDGLSLTSKKNTRYKKKNYK